MESVWPEPIWVAAPATMVIVPLSRAPPIGVSLAPFAAVVPLATPPELTTKVRPEEVAAPLKGMARADRLG